MNAIKTLLAISALALGVTAPLTGFAQADPGKTAMPMAASMTDGEVRKIDKDAGKLTIRHGEIKNLDMPPMTMVFTVKDKSLLDAVKAGDKIRFSVVDVGGKLLVTDIQPAK